jgi:hypothetical protein
VKLSVDRIVVRGAGGPADPRMLRSSLERELARALEPSQGRARDALTTSVSEAVLAAMRGDRR